MQFPEHVIAWLRSKGVPFSLHDGGTGPMTPDLSAGPQVVSSLVKTQLAFVNGRLAQLASRADHNVDRISVALASGRTAIELANPSQLQSMFPDLDIHCMPPLGNLWHMPVFIDTAVSQLPALRFHAGEPRIVMELALSDYRRVASPTIMTFATRDVELHYASACDRAGALG